MASFQERITSITSVQRIEPSSGGTQLPDNDGSERPGHDPIARSRARASASLPAMVSRAMVTAWRPCMWLELALGVAKIRVGASKIKALQVTKIIDLIQ